MFDENDLDLSFSKFFVDGRILLSLRVDVPKPPGCRGQAPAAGASARAEAQRKEPLSAGALRELKEMIALDLRRRTPPKTRTADVIWHLDDQKLYFQLALKAMNEAFLQIFSQTFNIAIDLEGRASGPRPTPRRWPGRGPEPGASDERALGRFFWSTPCPLAGLGDDDE